MSNNNYAFDPVHPGEILREDFMKPLGLSQYRLAKELGVPHSRICKIVNGKASITTDTALRLSRFFRMSDGFWLKAQMHYELRMAKRQLVPVIEREVTPRKLSAEEQAALAEAESQEQAAKSLKTPADPGTGIIPRDQPKSKGTTVRGKKKRTVYTQATRRRSTKRTGAVAED